MCFCRRSRFGMKMMMRRVFNRRRAQQFIYIMFVIHEPLLWHLRQLSQPPCPRSLVNNKRNHSAQCPQRSYHCNGWKNEMDRKTRMGMAYFSHLICLSLVCSTFLGFFAYFVLSDRQAGTRLWQSTMGKIMNFMGKKNLI